MDFHRLEVFLQVYRLKSFSRAGEALLLSQPTISEHIRVLEEDLGLTLFDRQGKEVSPTPAGKLLYHYAEQLIHLREESFRAMHQFRDKGSGELLIGGSNIPGQYLLPPLLGRFREKFPRIQIRLFIGDSRYVRDRLLEGVIELGVVGAPVEHRLIQCTFWAADHMVCVAPPRGKSGVPDVLSIEELLRSPFIFREKGSGTREAVEQAFKKIGVEPRQMKQVAEMGSNEAIRQAVKAGVGMSILSRRAVIEDLEAGRVREIKVNKLPLRREFYLITLKQRTLSPLAQEFKEFLNQTSFEIGEEENRERKSKSRK